MIVNRLAEILFQNIRSSCSAMMVSTMRWLACSFKHLSKAYVLCSMTHQVFQQLHLRIKLVFDHYCCRLIQSIHVGTVLFDILSAGNVDLWISYSVRPIHTIAINWRSMGTHGWHSHRNNATRIGKAYGFVVFS